MKLIVLYYTYCSCVSVYAFFSARCQLIFVFLSCFNETFMWLFYLTARAHHTLLVCISIKKYSMNFSMMFCSAFFFSFSSVWYVPQKYFISMSFFKEQTNKWNKGNVKQLLFMLCMMRMIRISFSIAFQLEQNKENGKA